MLLKKSINNIIMIILCITPFLFTPSLFDDYYFIKALFITLFTLLILIKWTLYEKSKINMLINMSSIVKLNLLYLFLMLLSTSFSVNILNSLLGIQNRWEGLVILISYSMLLIFSSQYFELSYTKLKILVISGCIMSTIGILQFLTILKDPIYYFPINMNFAKSFGTLGNPNYLGAYLTVMLSMSVYMYIYYGHFFYLISSNLIYTSLITSMTRGSWLGSAISLLILFLFFLICEKSYRKVIAIVISFITITIVLDVFLHGVIVLRFFSIILEFLQIAGPEVPDINSGSYRILIWTSLIKVLPKYPLLGVGISNIRFIFETYYSPIVNQMHSIGWDGFDRAHNEFLHIAATTGIPAMITYILLLVNSIQIAICNLQIKRENILLISIISGYAVQSFFSVSIVSFSFIIWIFMGTVDFLNRRPSSSTIRRY